MQGIYTDPGTGERQPPHVLAAWIQELLGDVRQAQVSRLAELSDRLQSTAFSGDNTLLAQSISTLRAASRELHFEGLRPGFLARTFGSYREVQAAFLRACQRIKACATGLRAELSHLLAVQKSETPTMRRVLVELDMERSALESEVDQGVTWLQDMCLQLGDARAHGGDEPQIAMLAEAAQHFTGELKRLQAACVTSRDLGVRGQALIDRRTAVLAQVRADIDHFDKDWKQHFGKLCTAVEAGHTSPPSLNAAAEVHEEVVRRLDLCADSCAALQREEHLMREHLNLLREQIEAGPRQAVAPAPTAWPD